MLRSAGIVALTLGLLPVLQAQTSPFVGRWDFNITQSNGKQAAIWLGIQEKAGGLDIWYQPTGGHVFQVPDYKVSGSRLTLSLEHDASIELDAKDDKLVGTQKRAGQSPELTGLPAPAWKGHEPKAWTKPARLFNGEDLSGWTRIGDTANNHWVVQDGDLLNETFTPFTAWGSGSA